MTRAMRFYLVLLLLSMAFFTIFGYNWYLKHDYYLLIFNICAFIFAASEFVNNLHSLFKDK